MSVPRPSLRQPAGSHAAEVPVGDARVPRLELAEWAERYGLVAGITTRGPGFSLGLWSAEAVGQVMTRWRTFRDAFRDRFPTVVLSAQVHGVELAWHERLPEGWLVIDGADGHATAEQGVLLTITVADCVPVYLAAPERGVFALLHAGWKGIAGGILKRGVEILAAYSKATPEHITMHCGVGICGSCYEVGSEVYEYLTGDRVNDRKPVDLRAVLARQAAALGIGAITLSPWCTAHDRDRFFSHRSSGGRDGRMVAYLGRPLA